MISSKFSSWSTLADSITWDSGVSKFHTVSWQQLESSTNPPTPCLHAHVPMCLTHRYVHTFTKLLVHSTKICLESIAAAAAKSLQSCPTLCDPIDSSPPGSPVPGIFQARTLEWVAISFSNAWKWKVKVKSLSRVQLLATPWTAAYQAPLCIALSRQEYWSLVPLPSPGECWASLKDRQHPAPVKELGFSVEQCMPEDIFANSRAISWQLVGASISVDNHPGG